MYFKGGLAVAIKEPKVRYYFDDEEPSETETHLLWGRLAYKLLELQQTKKEKKNGECFNVSGNLRKKEKFC